MIAMFKTELIELYAFIKRNGMELAIISLAVLFLILDRYHPIDVLRAYHPFDRRVQGHLFYYLLLPLLSIIFLLRRNPLDFGLRLGHVKIWGFHLAVACPVAFLIIYLGTSTSAVQNYYQAGAFNPFGYAVDMVLLMFSWEFICRGFLLFGLKRKMKEWAILVQMIPFTLLHLGKPEAEAISCIISGIYFGYVCYRGNSFYPAFILHCFIYYTTKVMTVYFA